jgi:hypothetical protein
VILVLASPAPRAKVARVLARLQQAPQVQALVRWQPAPGLRELCLLARALVLPWELGSRQIRMQARVLDPIGRLQGSESRSIHLRVAARPL